MKRHAAQVQTRLNFLCLQGMGLDGPIRRRVGLNLRGLSVDGIMHVSSVFEEIEKGVLRDLDFVEAQACSGGCVGGSLGVSNPFVARARLNALAQANLDAPPNPLIEDISADDPALWWSVDILPRPIFSLDDDAQEAKNKLTKLEKVLGELPGLDCGSCGAPTCRALAEDVVLGRGALSDCIFILRQRLETLAQSERPGGNTSSAMGEREHNNQEA